MAFSSVLFALTFLALIATMSEAKKPSYIKYTTVTGYFLQDDPATNETDFDYAAVNFGLINRAYDTDAEYDPELKKTQWQRFKHKVSRLNRQSGKHVNYKVLYLGRHGEGFHNAAEAYYGTPAWDDGNGVFTWADAHLTDTGVKQAEKAHAVWANEIATHKIAVPQAYYTSPLWRCLETARTTFQGLKTPVADTLAPRVKELLRETIGVHTCDRRSSKSAIFKGFPGIYFEHHFAENDPLWRPDLRETSSAQQARLTKLLDDVFSHNFHTFISFTTHGGSIAAILRAIGHRPFSVATGATITVLIKAEKVFEEPPSSTIAASTPPPTCTTNPTPSPRTGE